jgi:hypothetical protein
MNSSIINYTSVTEMASLLLYYVAILTAEESIQNKRINIVTLTSRINCLQTVYPVTTILHFFLFLQLVFSFRASERFSRT